MKNKKAISPVLAVLLMIAVAVAAALITYAWVMTYLESTTSRAGHAIQIQSVAFTDTTATVYAQNVGDGTIVLSNAYLDGAINADLSPLPALDEGDTATIAITVVAPATFEKGEEYKLKVVCKDGTFTEGTYTMP